MMLSAFSRKLILFLHVLTSVGFPGAVAGFLALVIIGATTPNAAIMRGAYVGAEIITSTAIVPLAWASLLFGILQSLLTPWGLFRYYWVIVKLALTLIAVGVLMLQIPSIAMLAEMATTGDLAAAAGPRLGIILHGGGGLLVLAITTLLSIYKPRGTTAYGARRLARGAP